MSGPVKDTPFGKGKTPTVAPSQTEAVAGKGPTQQGKAGHPTPPAKTPPPVSKGSTGPTIASPSVNYDANQDTPANVVHLGVSGQDYQSEQAQQLQDKGGA